MRIIKKLEDVRARKLSKLKKKSKSDKDDKPLCNDIQSHLSLDLGFQIIIP